MAGAHRLTILAIIFPLLVRAIPEILAGPFPLGFDTVWIYAPFVMNVETRGLGSALLEVGSHRAAPLLFLFLGIAATISQAEPFLVTKVAGVLLHSFLVFSVYYFARRGLRWDERKLVLLILLTSLYFLTLRFSWDMYKNTLGYGLLILALAHLSPEPTPRDKWVFLGLTGLSLLASELTTVLLGAIAGFLFVREWMRERRPNSLMVAVGVLSLVTTLVYLQVLVPPDLPASPLTPIPGVTVLYNYVGAAQDIYIYPGLGDVYADVLLLTGILLAPLIPFVWLGWRRDRRLDSWTVPLCVGAFSILVIPFAAIPMWHRWLFMLAFPLLIFAVMGLDRSRRRTVGAFFGVVLLLSVSYLVLPPETAFPYYTHPRTLQYVPSSMLQNTVPIDASPDVVAALQSIGEAQTDSSVLIAHISFVGWAKLYAPITEVYSYVSADQVNNGDFGGYRQVFLIYWATEEGWFKASLLPRNMVEIHRTGDIAIYELEASQIEAKL